MTDWRLSLRKLGGDWRVGRILGEGGQGSVYELIPDDPQRRTLALKWYRPEATYPAQRSALLRLTEQAAPSDEFLWPLEVIDGTDGAFGYVMPIRSAKHVPVADLLTGKVDVGFSTVARLCMGLADSFLKLHAQGLCYRDISIGNVFFDPSTGRPLICDNDNVGIDGREPARVMGTSRFMAPEIVRNEAQPSTATDLFSLAVLIFYVLMIHHPLQGRRELDFACFDKDAELELFGSNPLFVFDPVDDSNAPDAAAHTAVLQYWPLYPAYVRAEFTRAFGAGLLDPSQRVREGVWRSRMSRLLDGVVECSCGRENFTDDGVPGSCWSCGKDIEPPPLLEIGGRVLVLNAGTRLTRHHLVRDYDYDTVVGVVTAHPAQPSLWGLTNHSGSTWHVLLPGGVERSVEPGRSLGLVLGTELVIDNVTATLRG
jgi:eukaryotic-like serine/threonine-protein kinase